MIQNESTVSKFMIVLQATIRREHQMLQVREEEPIRQQSQNTTNG